MVNNKDDFEVLSNILDSRTKGEREFVNDCMKRTDGIVVSRHMNENTGIVGISSVITSINDGKSLKIVRRPKIVLSAKVTKRKKTLLKRWMIVVGTVAISVVVAVVGFSENVFGKHNYEDTLHTSATSSYSNSEKSSVEELKTSDYSASDYSESSGVIEGESDNVVIEADSVKGVVDDESDNDYKDDYDNTLIGENVNMNENSLFQNQVFWNVGCADDIDNVRDFLNNTEEGYYIRTYSQIYGVDPSIIAAMCKVESISLNHEDCIPGGIFYNGYGVGLMQFESPDVNTRTISAINVNTGEIDYIDLNMDSALDKEKNIKMGIMSFQNSLYDMDGNIYLAILCHNFGEPMVELVLRENNLWDTRGDITDVRWIDFMRYAHFHPNTYLSEDYWPPENGKYGGENYVESVLEYCETDASYNYKGDMYNIDLGTMQVSQQQIRTL